MKLVQQEHTKCPHCGHTYSELYFEFDYVDRYKSGPRKGQVKSARQEKTVFRSGLPFDEIMSDAGHNAIPLVVKDEESFNYRKKILACPNCRVLFVDGKCNEPVLFTKGNR